MQPPHLSSPDLDAALSYAGVGTRWRSPAAPRQTATTTTPAAAPWSRFTPSASVPAPVPVPESVSVPVPVPVPVPAPVPSLLPLPSPSPSPMQMPMSPPAASPPRPVPADRDPVRRALAASGLDVSAPEFVPSFAVSPPVTPAPTPASAPLYIPPENTRPTPRRTAALHPASPVFHPRAPAFHTTPYYPTSPRPAAIAARPPHLDEATYVTAVQTFESEFPALRKPPHSNPSNLPASPSTPPTHWHAAAAAAAAAATPTDHDHHSAIFPKALGWDALRREEARKRLPPAPPLSPPGTTLWQNISFDDDHEDFDFDLEELFDPDEPRLSNDIGALWVSTGKSVSQLYQSLRAEAAEEARLRNKYFDRAAAAFKRNDGASAKRLGALGRDANDRMKELHKQAAEAIFEARNPSYVTDIVDLHGLHVSEALERLPPALQKALPGTLRILTGTGHHTKGTGRARLRPAVKKWLQENGYFFEEVVDANEYVGSFKVEIAR